MSIIDQHTDLAAPRTGELHIEVADDLTVIVAPPTPYILHLWGPDHPRVAEARLLERAVFFEAFGNTPELLAQEYGRYEASSLWAVVEDRERQLVIGAIRFIVDAEGDLKSFVDVGAEPWGADLGDLIDRHGLDLSRTLDVATLSVHPEYRGKATAGLVSLALYQAVCQLADVAEMTHFIAILDAAVFKSIQTRVGAPFQLYDGVEPASYLDSPVSIPCYAEVAEWRGRLAETSPETDAILFRGEGFEEVFEAPDWAAAKRHLVQAALMPTG